jgi:hypothetical protein
MAVEQAGVGLAGEERRVPQRTDEQVAVGDYAVDASNRAASSRVGAQATTLASSES